ncbi:MAG TPA: DUF4360 domain-containing protein [Polyangiales bacterium]
MRASDAICVRNPGLLLTSLLALVGCADGAAGSAAPASELDAPSAAASATTKRSGREASEPPRVQIVSYAFEGELCGAEEAQAEVRNGTSFDLSLAGEPLLAEHGSREARCEVTLELRVARGFTFSAPSIRFALESGAASKWETSYMFREGTSSSFEHIAYDDEGQIALEHRPPDLWSPTCASDEPFETVHFLIRMTSTAHAGERPGYLQLTRLGLTLTAEAGLAWEPCTQRQRDGVRRALKQPREHAMRSTPL